MTGKGILLTELPPDLQRKLEPKTHLVPERMIALGRVLQIFEGMARRDALWVLRRAARELGSKR